jgi:hypothetical protein
MAPRGYTRNETKDYVCFYGMHVFSIYAIHTDFGVYIGQTCDLTRRMVQHYGHGKVWNMGRHMQRVGKAIRNTPDHKLRVEEIGYYRVNDKRDAHVIERYWIRKMRTNLNVVHRIKPRTLHMDTDCELEKVSRIYRSPEDMVTLDMKYQFDLDMVTRGLYKLDLSP